MVRTVVPYFIKHSKDASCEFDEFRVDTPLCRLRYWYLKYTMWVSFSLNGRGPVMLFFFFVHAALNMFRF